MTLAAVWGCDQRPSASSSSPGEATAAAIRSDEQDRFSDDMLPIAFESIVHLEEYDAPEVLGQAVDRLNQWLRYQKPQPGWKPDPLVSTLPEPLANMPVVQELGKMEFTLGTPNIDGGARRRRCGSAKSRNGLAATNPAIWIERWRCSTGPCGTSSSI